MDFTRWNVPFAEHCVQTFVIGVFSTGFHWDPAMICKYGRQMLQSLELNADCCEILSYSKHVAKSFELYSIQLSTLYLLSLPCRRWRRSTNRRRNALRDFFITMTLMWSSLKKSAFILGVSMSSPLSRYTQLPKSHFWLCHDRRGLASSGMRFSWWGRLHSE